jgi:hypothetical protein
MGELHAGERTDMGVRAGPQRSGDSGASAARIARPIGEQCRCGMGKRLWRREEGWREQRKPKDATMRAKCINDAALILGGLIQ